MPVDRVDACKATKFCLVLSVYAMFVALHSIRLCNTPERFNYILDNRKCLYNDNDNGTSNLISPEGVKRTRYQLRVASFYKHNEHSLSDIWEVSIVGWRIATKAFSNGTTGQANGQYPSDEIWDTINIMMYYAPYNKD